MTEALANTRPPRVYICNLMTKLGETDGFTASRFVREMHRYLGGSQLDWVLVNTGNIPAPVKEAYQREGAYPVTADVELVGRMCRESTPPTWGMRDSVEAPLEPGCRSHYRNRPGGQGPGQDAAAGGRVEPRRFERWGSVQLDRSPGI